MANNALTVVGSLVSSIPATTTSPQFLVRYMLTPRRLGTNRRLRVIIDCTITSVLTLAPTLTVTLNFGNQNVVLTAAQLLGLVMTDRPFQIIATITAQDSMNKQWGTISLTAGQFLTLSAVLSLNAKELTINTLAMQEVSVSIAFSGIAAGTVITPRTRVPEVVG